MNNPTRKISFFRQSFDSKSERYLGKEQSPGQLRLGLMEEVTVEVIVPAPVPAEKVK